MYEPKRWVTSDLHFFDNKIVKHCNRPCSKEGHVDWIVETLNSYIHPMDEVYYCGDLCVSKSISANSIKTVMARLNGKWRFIIGNRDDRHTLELLCENTDHKVLGHIYNLEHKEHHFVMCHFPIEMWWNCHLNWFHLHGHTHDKDMPYIANRYNICFDKEFKPYLLDDFVIKEGVSAGEDALSAYSVRGWFVEENEKKTKLAYYKVVRGCVVFKTVESLDEVIRLKNTYEPMKLLKHLNKRFEKHCKANMPNTNNDVY